MLPCWDVRHWNPGTVVLGRADNNTLRRRVYTELSQAHRANQVLRAGAATNLGRTVKLRRVVVVLSSAAKKDPDGIWLSASPSHQGSNCGDWRGAGPSTEKSDVADVTNQEAPPGSVERSTWRYPISRVVLGPSGPKVAHYTCMPQCPRLLCDWEWGPWGRLLIGHV